MAFQSSLTKNLENLKHQETVIFDRVLLNEGKAYNKNTGKFTATVEGVYSFTWTIFSVAGKFFITEIVHNGNPITCNYCDGRGRKVGYIMTSSQANIKMKRGDKVWIRCQSNHCDYARGGYSSNFSGFKVWKKHQRNDNSFKNCIILFLFCFCVNGNETEVVCWIKITQINIVFFFTFFYLNWINTNIWLPHNFDFITFLKNLFV